MKVLVLGNGISRLIPAVAERIAAWKGEIWGCNRVYQEPLASRLTRVTGHAQVLADAAAYRAEHGLTFQTWGGNLAQDVERTFSCPADFRRDSGTTLVAQALHEGHQVVAAGFDLGGADVHSPEMWTQLKSVWVRRWRAIGDHYGWDRIEFWGHDHKPFLLSVRPPSSYQRLYATGVPHIPGAEYRELLRERYGDGVGIYPGSEDRMVKFLWNGQSVPVDMNERVAAIFDKRGRGVIVREVASPAPASEPHPEDSVPAPAGPEPTGNGSRKRAASRASKGR